MANKTELMQVLQHHRGKANGIHVKHLAHQLDATERAARKLVAEAREDGLPICGKPETGYYLAANQEEIDETVAFLESRVKTTLDQIARLKSARMSSPQLSLI